MSALTSVCSVAHIQHPLETLALLAKAGLKWDHPQGAAAHVEVHVCLSYITIKPTPRCPAVYMQQDVETLPLLSRAAG